MQESKLVKVPIHVGVNSCTNQCPNKQKEEEDISHVQHASVIGSLIYAIVCIRQNSTCSGSFEWVYVKTNEGALDKSLKDFQVFVWHFYLWSALPRKTRIKR
jgi:hypothetical protein